MLCDKCKKNIATYYSELSINGIVTEEHLCAECAGIKKKFPLIDFMRNFFGGYTLQDVIVGYNGCRGYHGIDNCNDSLIDNALKSVNIGASNCCKEYSVNGNNLVKIRELKCKLEEAVSSENYELASVIKKEIDELKKGNK